MHKKHFYMMFSPFLILLIIPFVVQAATITMCTFDRETYHQGQTGYITVTIFNDEEDKIRITELTATIDYYYIERNVYMQSFFTNATLPAEIQKGQTSTFHIPFSLPINIASGYTEVYVKAKTEIWNNESDRWFWSDHPTYQPTLFIESPYKPQLEEQLSINKNTTTIMYLLGVTTIVFGTVTVFLYILNRRARLLSQPIA